MRRHICRICFDALVTRALGLTVAPLRCCGQVIPFEKAVHFYTLPFDMRQSSGFLRTVLNGQITGNACVMRARIAELYRHRNAFEVDGEAMRWSG
jgi:hypothetical protein